MSQPYQRQGTTLAQTITRLIRIPFRIPFRNPLRTPFLILFRIQPLLVNPPSVPGTKQVGICLLARCARGLVTNDHHVDHVLRIYVVFPLQNKAAPYSLVACLPPATIRRANQRVTCGHIAVTVRVRWMVTTWDWWLGYSSHRKRSETLPPKSGLGVGRA